MVRPRKLGLDLVLSANRSVSPPTSLSLRSRSWLSAGPIGRRESIAWTKAEMSSSSVFVLKYDAFYDKVCEQNWSSKVDVLRYELRDVWHSHDERGAQFLGR